MPYYMLDKCPEEKLDDIGALCTLHALEEQLCQHPVRSWEGKPESLIQVVKYSPIADGPPLLVQCLPGNDYKSAPIGDFLKQLMQITGSTQLYEGAILDALSAITLP